jgi:hypothetical protein
VLPSQKWCANFIATLIIAAASRGELDPVRLRMVAVAGFATRNRRGPSHFRSAESEWKDRGRVKKPRGLVPLGSISLRAQSVPHR